MKTLVTLLALIFSTLLSVGAVTGFYYTSGPSGSYIAQGKTANIEPGADWIFQTPTECFSGWNAVCFPITGPSTSTSWSIYVQMPFDGLITEGSYIATRFPFNSENFTGFDWSGGSRGNNTSTTWFSVLEAEYSGGGISALAVDFVQFEATWGQIDGLSLNDARPWAYGSFRYNSSIPIDQNMTQFIPEPSVGVLLLTVGPSILLRRRR